MNEARRGTVNTSNIEAALQVLSPNIYQGPELNCRKIHTTHVSYKSDGIYLFILMIKVSSVLQAAWLRFQEVQALHQLQPDLPYQEVPAGRRKRGWEGQLIASVLQINRLILKNRTVEYIHARISEKFWWNTDPFAWVTDGARRSRRARWARGTLKMWRSIYYTYFLHITNIKFHM